MTDQGTRPDLAGVNVEAEKLACVRGGRAVFDGVDLCAGPGELVAVTGPNGAGKSSLLRILAGLLRPAGGALSIRSAGTSGSEAERHGLIHYLGHLDGLKAGIGLGANLAFWQRLYAGEGQSGEGPGESGKLAAHIADAMALTGIAHLAGLPVAVLSAGQRRRAALARLMVSPRPLWLLDEPTASLDADGEAMLGRLIDAHLSRGGTVVAATHLDLPVAPARTVALADGAGA